MATYCSIGCLAVLAAACALLTMNSQRVEPVYAGKTVDEWLAAGYEDASMALHEIGPPALPYIVAKLSREDPACGSLRRYHNLWNEIPLPVRRLFPRPKPASFDELRACGALLELGPQIIPVISIGLQDRNPVVRELSAHVLGVFRERGKNIGQAVPSLIEARRDPNPKVRARAAWALDRAFLAQ